MKGFRVMLAKAAAIGAMAAVAAGISGCGETIEKRAVDARTEAVHFFAADAPAVAILRTEPPSDVAALNRGGDSLPAFHALRMTVVAPLSAAGLTVGQVNQLVKAHVQIPGLASSALALGAPTPNDLQNHQPLLVLATDQTDLLADLFRRSVAARKVRPAGQLHDADLYQGSGYAYAIRDGVLVSAPTLGDVRTAILRRDGDSDLQLDEDVVQSLFNDLTERGPLLVYANLGAIRQADAGLTALGQRMPWTGALGPGAASVEPTVGGLHIEAFAKSNGPDLTTSGVPVGAEPKSFSMSATRASTLVQAGPTQMMLDLLAPIAGQATVTSDEVRVNLRLGG